MGNSYAGQFKATRFEEVLHNSIEASLRSNSLVPRPIFSQLYLAGDNLEGQDDEDEDGGSGSSSPPILYQNNPAPEGSCTMDGFCQAGKDLRLESIASNYFEVPPGFLLVGARSPNLPNTLLVCVVDKRFLPDDDGLQAYLGFAGNCAGCGEKGFRYFTEFSNHINLKLTTQPKKQKLLQFYLLKNSQGKLTKGPAITWKNSERRSRHSSSSVGSSTGLAAQDGSENTVNKTDTATVSSENVMGENPLPGDGAVPIQTTSSHQNMNGSPCAKPTAKLNQSLPVRSSVLGNLTNSGPPKKRHKDWSPESPSSSESCLPQNGFLNTSSGGKACNFGQLCAPQSTPASGLMASAVVATGEPVSVPDNLLETCMTKLVIFKGHGNFPYLCGNISDVVVSPLLHNCYKNSQSIPKAYEQYGPSTLQPVSEEMQLLLTVYYLVQLAPDQVPLIEDMEQIFMRSWRETHLAEIRQYQQNVSHAFPQFPSPVIPVTTAQLPWLAGLAASSCSESVKIIECSLSLAEGLSEMFKLLTEGKLSQTNYVVIICTSRHSSFDSCIVVTGKVQARILLENLYSPAECLKEVSYELVSGKVESLGTFFNELIPDGDIDLLLDKFHQEYQETRSLSPKCTNAETRTVTCTSYSVDWHQIRPTQLAVAQKLLSHVCSIADSSTQNLDLGSFEKVDFVICVPPSEVTYQQTMSCLWSSGVLLEVGLEKDQLTKECMEQYILKLDSGAPSKFRTFLQRTIQNPHTLFVLVNDHAHWDLSSPYSSNESSAGLTDSLLNCREVKDAPNILVLHVTSFPYALQTQNTRISPYNEIHWPSTHSHGMDLYHENRKHFGLPELIEATVSGHSLPLLRHDSSFEAIVIALGKRFPKLHTAVIRTFLLVQHYSAGMMAVCGLSQMKNRTSVETLEIIQNLLNSSKQCSSGHGIMVLLRIPFIQLATLAYERLCHVRERLGLHHRFEIILGAANSPISIRKHFMDQLRTWQKIQDEDWCPKTYMALEGLPCILILSGMSPLGESLPRSLRYCDLRLVHFSTWERTTIEQELGLASCFIDTTATVDKAVGRDILDSEPDKLSSTDFEDEEMVIDGSISEKTSPNKRRRSQSHNSTSSLCSKSSGSAFCSDVPPPCADENTGKMSQQPGVSNAGESATDTVTVKPPTDKIIKKPSEQTSEQPDGNSSSQNAKSSPSSDSASSSSSTSAYFQSGTGVQTAQCSMAKTCKQPPIVFLPKLLYDVIMSTDSSGLSKISSFLPHCDVSWASSFRPLLSKMMTYTEQSLYYRQWSVPKQSHMDYSNISDGRMDAFHPRRLLLSGPPQVGKTGAYLQFLSILSRMLIRLTEVDVYDEQEINIIVKDQTDLQFHQEADKWPNVEIMKKMDFDYSVHDPKYEDASVICSDVQNLSNEAERTMNRRPDEIYIRRPTTRMRLSKYASYNTYHHCEQCHQYMGYNPRFQMYESSLHAFAFSCSMLGEEIQLHFIIPKSKEHHFVFSQPGGQLESMRLPLVTDKNTDCVKSPIFTSTTGRHEHGLFNLYHAMDGSSHLHILVVKEYEMAIYKKYWPNHIMLVLPNIFNSAGVGAAHFLIKELSYHNLELERSRQAELGVRPQDIWPFIVIADDSCVMWNTTDVNVTGDQSREYSWSERNVSLKYILQHMESSPHVTQYAVIGMRKWTSKTKVSDWREPFSRCHLHDFILLNVDLTRDVQYNQNRFTCDDVDFNVRVNSSGLLICRFNRFSVMKKQIAVGGHRSLHVKSKVLDSSVSISPAHYICAPDSKHTILAAPAHLLLEKYLQFHSHRFFPLSVNNTPHPVLIVDCYLNLGPQISVCYVSSRPHSVNVTCADVMFSGLLLHLCDSFVVASFLKQFKFLKGATLCVICQDRNSLRQTVARLELEDEWQFRLRDEFQTANAKEDKPLFILTGRHV